MSGVSGGGLILRTAVTAISVDAKAAAMDGIIIKYHSRVLTSPSETSLGFGPAPISGSHQGQPLRLKFLSTGRSGDPALGGVGLGPGRLGLGWLSLSRPRPARSSRAGP